MPAIVLLPDPLPFIRGEVVVEEVVEKEEEEFWASRDEDE